MITSSYSKQRFIYILKGSEGSIWSTFCTSFFMSNNSTTSLDIPIHSPKVQASYQYPIVGQSPKGEFCSLGISVVVHYSHNGWNKIAGGMSKHFGWFGILS